MRHISELQWFLRVQIVRSRQSGKLWLSQLSYINKLAVNHKINPHAKAPSMSMPYEELQPYEGEFDSSSYHVYAKAVGSIIYPAVIARPDIARAASKLAEYLTNPGPTHLHAVDHCIRYLYGTRYLAIEYSTSNFVGELTTSLDLEPEISHISANASFANSPTDVASKATFSSSSAASLIGHHVNRQRSRRR